MRSWRLNFVSGNNEDLRGVSMRHQEIEELVQQVNQELIQLSQTVNRLSQELTRLQAENNRLRMQQYDAVEQMDLSNHFSSSLGEEEIQVSGEREEVVHQSGQARLQSFYNEGIHICHHYFGQKRDSQEACIFCQDIIDSLGES